MTLKILHWLCRLILAGIFLYSGYVKIQEPLQFAVAIAGYKMVPDDMVFPLARFLPWLEIVLGYNILIGWKLRYNAVAAGALLLFFIVILSITIGRGIDANCGCFSLDERISPKTVARDSLILLPAIFLSIESRLRKLFRRSASAASDLATGG